MSICQRLEVANGLCACPKCAYQNGFHIALHPAPGANGHTGVSLRLVCPSCSATYDAGLVMTLQESRPGPEADAT